MILLIDNRVTRMVLLDPLANTLLDNQFVPCLGWPVQESTRSTLDNVQEIT